MGGPPKEPSNSRTPSYYSDQSELQCERRAVLAILTGSCSYYLV